MVIPPAKRGGGTESSRNRQESSRFLLESSRFTQESSQKSIKSSQLTLFPKSLPPPTNTNNHSTKKRDGPRSPRSVPPHYIIEMLLKSQERRLCSVY